MWSWLSNSTQPLIDNEDKSTYKVIIIGSSSAGKSSLLYSFSDDTFNHNFITTCGIDFKTHTFDIGDKKLNFVFFDSCGQERFRSITASYYKKASGILLVYDITNKSSFDELGSWMDELNQYCDQKLPKILIGNKFDLAQDRQVSYEEAYTFAQSLDIDFFETSAKTAFNVKKVFEKIAMQISRDDCDHVKIKIEEEPIVLKPVSTSCC